MFICAYICRYSISLRMPKLQLNVHTLQMIGIRQVHIYMQCQKPKYYHCLIDEYGRLIQKCFQRILVPKGKSKCIIKRSMIKIAMFCKWHEYVIGIAFYKPLLWFFIYKIIFQFNVPYHVKYFPISPANYKKKRLLTHRRSDVPLRFNLMSSVPM